MSTPCRSSAGDGLHPLEPLSVTRISSAAALDDGPRRWLVDSLWDEQAVGLIAGPPKNFKTWLSLDLAISVATATAALGRFPVQTPGPVLVYFAEDSLSMLHQRIASICGHRGIAVDSLDLHLITAPTLRLDLQDDQKRLSHAIETYKPRLLLLDPLVRLHRLRENDAGEISGLLAYLREQQRRFGCAVILVHHMTKRIGADLGQALRGSGDLYAFGDSNAYLTRRRGQVRLAVEHRAAAAIDPLCLQLVADHRGNPHLEVVNAAEAAEANRRETPPLDRAVLQELRAASRPLTRHALRDALRVNNQRLGQVLVDLQQQGDICRSAEGWMLSAGGAPASAVAPPSVSADNNNPQLSLL